MRPSEAVDLVALVSALCPGQKWTEHTPDAWAAVLDDVPYPDAVTAMRTLYRDRGNDAEFGPRRIEADDILREVKRMRRVRLEAAPEYVPSRLGMTVEEEVAELRAYRRAVADGHPPTRPQLTGAPRRAIPVLTRRIDQ